jgi:iron complex transport system substrate-binding protein
MFSIRYIGRILSAARPRVKPRALLLLTPAVLLLLPVPFSPSSPPAFAAATAIDANGDTVALPAPPRRILVTGKSALVPSDALFLFPASRTNLLRLARVNQGLGNFQALLLPSLADDASVPDTLRNGGTEELAALHPDLVVAKTAATESVIRKLRPLGIPCFAMSLETPDEWLRELPQLGRLLGEDARADEILRLFRTRLDAVETGVRAALAPGVPRPRVLLLQISAADGTTAFSVSPDNWLQTWMVEAAGGDPVWKGTGLTASGWSKISFEQIAAWDPDAIYFVSFKAPVAPLLAAVKADSRWRLLRAARTGRLRAMPADLVAWAQPVSRWILCLQWLAADLHPEAFPDFAPETALADFYRDFYAVPSGPVLDALLSAFRASLP